MKNYRLLFACLLLLPGMTSCEREKESQPPAAVQPVWQALETDALTPHQRAMVDYAGQSRGIMGQRLMGTVMSAAQESGFDGAIEVCKQEAQPIAKEIEENRKVRIGRTSNQLRNPENRAPLWMEELLPSDSEELFVALESNGTLGVGIPIFLAAPCMNCHGVTEVLAEGVPQALDRLYPDDQAIGYNKGDLRGWFWVEVPPESVAVPPRRDQGEPEEKALLSRGEELYLESCAACHGRQGEGVPRAFPPLIGTERVLGPPGALIALSLDGVSGPLKVGDEEYNGFMPGQAQHSNEDLAELLTFVRSSWGNNASAINADEVDKVRRATALRTSAWTAEELQELGTEPEY